MPAANVLVTGASGFIGSHLVARLLSEDRRVTALVRTANMLRDEWRDRPICFALNWAGSHRRGSTKVFGPRWPPFAEPNRGALPA